MSASDPLGALGLSLRAGAVEVALVRHADAIPEDGLHGTNYDDYELHGLSERGVAQAQAAATYLAEQRRCCIAVRDIKLHKVHLTRRQCLRKIALASQR